MASRYYEKDDVLISDCYSYEAGEIHYFIDADTDEIQVKIGNDYYDYSPESIYFFPEGSSIKKHQRFCNGVCNIRKVTSDLNDPREVYDIFRKQIYESSSGDYANTGIIGDGDNNEEIVEVTFASLTHTSISDEGKRDIDYMGVRGGIMDNDSFYTLLSYGYSGKVVNRALKGDIELKDDSSTRIVLGLLLNGGIDK